MSLIRRLLRFLLGCLQWAMLCIAAFFLGMFAAPVAESRWLEERVGLLEATQGRAAPGRLAPGSVLGRVQIDRLDVDAVILEGIDESVLRRAVGHFPGTRLPWQSGTVGLAAHRDAFFRELEGIRQGDKVRLVTEHGSWTYEVTSFDVVDPDAVHVLEDREASGLTLVTCYPFDYLGRAPQRFIVMARRLG